MNFEQLANEVLFNIFEYVPSVKLLQSFFHLNHRINSLIIDHFRIHGLNLQSISKVNFDIICHKHLPYIRPYLTGLRISDDDDTPNQVKFLMSHCFSLNQFAQLKFVTLYRIFSNETLQQTIQPLCYNHELIHLNIINCKITFDRKILRDILNYIWHIPKLTHCHFDIPSLSGRSFYCPTIRSKSIEYLCIKEGNFDTTALILLFRCTPNLRNLTAHIGKLPDNTQFASILSSVSSMNLVIDHLTDGSINLLQKTPALTSLTLQLGKPYMNGHQWKQFILDYLPKLIKFRFLMFFPVDTEDELNQFIDTFRTPFWLIDHQWFIRCHWGLQQGNIMTFIYTLPYPFSYFSFVISSSNVYTISTCPNEDDYRTYNRVTTLLPSYLPSNDSFLCRIRFNNIHHVKLSFPISDRFFTIFLQFDQVTSLTVSTDNHADADVALSQLQMVINRVPRLHLLTFDGWSASPIQHLPNYLTHNSIRRLNLQSNDFLKNRHCFNSEQCTTFLRSSLAKQCQVLHIVLVDQSDIEKLINGMGNLQALNVMFRADQDDDFFPSREQWIQYLSSISSCTFPEILPGTEIRRMWIR